MRRSSDPASFRRPGVCSSRRLRERTRNRGGGRRSEQPATIQRGLSWCPPTSPCSGRVPRRRSRVNARDGVPTCLRHEPLGKPPARPLPDGRDLATRPDCPILAEDGHLLDERRRDDDSIGGIPMPPVEAQTSPPDLRIHGDDFDDPPPFGSAGKLLDPHLPRPPSSL